MDKGDIDAVADVAMEANRQFTARHTGASTRVGIISSTIRSMGIEADAVSIDCGHSGKRLVLILMDRMPGRVGVGIGQKDTVGDYELIRQVALNELTTPDILAILEARFAHSSH